MLSDHISLMQVHLKQKCYQIYIFFLIHMHFSAHVYDFSACWAIGSFGLCSLFSFFQQFLLWSLAEVQRLFLDRLSMDSNNLITLHFPLTLVFYNRVNIWINTSSYYSRLWESSSNKENPTRRLELTWGGFANVFAVQYRHHKIYMLRERCMEEVLVIL